MPTRVLIVDDEGPVRECVTLILSEKGCEAESASNAGEALAMLKAQPFDLVVTDFLMRGMNGRQLAWVIKSIYPRMPVILVTGFFPSCPISEIDRVLLKPFSRQQLWTAIGEVFMKCTTNEATEDRAAA